jgi:hypothetical protein
LPPIGRRSPDGKRVNINPARRKLEDVEGIAKEGESETEVTNKKRAGAYRIENLKGEKEPAPERGPELGGWLLSGLILPFGVRHQLPLVNRLFSSRQRLCRRHK